MKSIPLGPDWLDSYASGDQEAYTRFMTLHYRFILFRARKLLADEEMAEELSHCALLAAWEQRETFSRPGQVVEFVLKRLREDCMIHKGYYSPASQLPASPTEFFEIEPFILEIEKRPPSPERIRREDMLEMLQRYKCLPTQHKNILHMRHAEQKAISRIANELGTTSEAVISRLSRATRHMLSLCNQVWFHLPWFIAVYHIFYFLTSD
jgi:RNA polymerase sigma factor (sigma-70 family)